MASSSDLCVSVTVVTIGTAALHVEIIDVSYRLQHTFDGQFVTHGHLSPPIVCPVPEGGKVKCNGLYVCLCECGKG